MLIVTGMSGAGRSTVGNALEDLGWYVVDNLPPQMLRPLVDLAEHTGRRDPEGRRGRRRARRQALRRRAGERRRDAARQRPACACSSSMRPTRRSCAASSRCGGRIRCRATARCSTASPPSAQRMAELREQSDIVIDTSELNIHQLATPVAEQFARRRAADASRVTVMSFGFKYGLPSDADMVADMRFLPNPFWMPELRAADRPRRAGARLRARPAGRRGVRRRATSRRSPRCSTGTGARTSDTLRSPWAARAASTARSRSSKSWRTDSVSSPGSPSACEHRDLGRE